MAILRISAVSAATGLSPSLIYVMSAKGTFPAPIRLTKRTLGWREEEIDQWVNARAAEGYKPERRPRDVIDKAVQQRSANRAARTAGMVQQDVA